MKKILIVLLVCCFIITGCGTNDNQIGKLECSKESIDEDGYKTIDNMTVTYKNNEVTNVSQTTLTETDPEFIEFSLTFGNAFAEKLNVVDGINVKYSKENEKTIKYTMDIDYAKVDVNDVKNALGDLFDEEDGSIYSNEKLNLEEFKNENLKDYTCK